MLEAINLPQGVAQIFSVQIPLVVAVLLVIVVAGIVSISRRRVGQKAVESHDEAFTGEMVRLRRRINELEGRVRHERGETERLKRKSRRI